MEDRFLTKAMQSIADELLYTAENDNRNKRELTDTRRKPLTLKHLSKLRRLKTAKQIESQVKSKLVQREYEQVNESLD